MGYFSWMFADRDNQKALRIGKKGYLFCPDGTVLTEPDYKGYGVFDGHDAYELVADWNRKYLSQHPEHLIPRHGGILQEDGTYKVQPPKRIDSYSWYPFYADLSLSRDEVIKRAGLTEYRDIGIDIACYDDWNANLPCPIKVCKTKRGLRYDSLPPSNSDPDQGF